MAVNPHNSSLLPDVNTELSTQPAAMRLTRSLSAWETWGFGLTGPLAWIGTAPFIHAALGPQAIFVWLPAMSVGILLNLQVKSLGIHWPEMAGGTPNYLTRLLKRYSGLGRYGAIAYFLGWARYLPVNAVILTELIRLNLAPLGIACPETALKIGFTIIAYLVAFSGTRALGILHTFFIVPAVGLLLVFCIQGIGWLAFAPNSPGLFPSHWSSLSFGEWSKWYFFGVYCTYSCETAASFVADSRRPGETLRFLSFAAWLMPPVYLLGSWVLMRLASERGLGEDTFLNLSSAAQPFWGDSAPFIVTLLIASSCLLNCATGVSNSPRILYQLAVDGHLSPVFTVVTRQGILQPALIFTLLISLTCLVWGDITHIVVVTGTCWLAAMMIFHLGLWLGRDRAQVRWPRWSLGFFVIEAMVLVLAGFHWGLQDVLIGLLFPIAVLGVDAAIRRSSFAPFRTAWWMERYQRRVTRPPQDFVAFQVIVLILLVCSTATITWVIKTQFDRGSVTDSHNLLVVLLMTLTFGAIAVACWTSLPQVTALVEARERAENLSITARETETAIRELYEVTTRQQLTFDQRLQQMLGIGCRRFELDTGTKAIAELKAEQVLPETVELRQRRYLNNIVEQDHSFIKRLVKLGMGFGSFNTARRTLRGYETMQMLRKGQIQGVAKDAVTDRVKFIAEIFGVAA